MLDWFRLSEIESLRFTAWATVSLAVLTALLAIGAVANAVLLSRQNGYIARGLEDGRRQWLDTATPLVLFERAALLPEPAQTNKRFVEVTLRNVGTGPALEVEVKAQIDAIPKHEFDRQYDPGRNFFDGWAKNLASDGTATHTRRAMVIAVGESRALYLRGPSGVLLEMSDDTLFAVVTASVRFQDIHGRTFYQPRKLGDSTIPVTYRVARLESRRPDIAGETAGSTTGTSATIAETDS